MGIKRISVKVYDLLGQEVATIVNEQLDAGRYTRTFAGGGLTSGVFSYQGVLTDTLGTPKPDGRYAFTFRLYAGTTGGSPLWSEAKTLPVKGGLFQTLLADQVVFGPSLTFAQPYWLSVQVTSEPEVAPRIPLTTTAYSFHVLNADTARYALAAPLQSSVDSARIAGTVPNNAITS